MSHLTHEHALYERLLTHPKASEFALHGYQHPPGYRLIQSPTDASSEILLGVGLIHLDTRSVVFWGQMQLHLDACASGLPLIHFLGRRKPDPELWHSAHAPETGFHVGQLLLLQALESGHVAITRKGLEWSIWEEMLAVAVAQGYSLYTLSDGLLSKHNLGVWELMNDPLGLTLLSGKADLDGSTLAIDPSRILSADRDFLSVA